MAKTLLMVLLAVLNSACAPLTTVQPDGSIAYHHFGYVKVIIPNSLSSSDTPVSATDVTTVGIRIQDGVGVGYFRDKHVVVPLDCRTVFLVKNQEQLDQILKTLGNLKEGEGLCASIYPQE